MAESKPPIEFVTDGFTTTAAVLALILGIAIGGAIMFVYLAQIGKAAPDA